MNGVLPFDPTAGTALQGARLGVVVSVDDPMAMGRVQVRLPGTDDPGDAAQWARVAVPFAGPDRGAFFIPDVGDEVVVVFLGGSARSPVVVGSLWNGAGEMPEDQPSGEVKRWTITGKNGTRIAVIEESSGQEKVEIETPNGALIRVTEEGGGEVKLDAGGSTVTLGTNGVEVTTGSNVTVNASQVSVSAGMVTVDSGMAKFSGVVQCSTLVTNSVVSTSYTPGAGNIW